VDDRADLREAIAGLQQARERVRDHRESLDRARSAVSAGRRKVERAEHYVEKAKERAAIAAASRIERGANEIAGGKGITAAMDALEAGNRALQIAQSALAKLQGATADVEFAVVDAEAAITVEINCLLAPLAHIALERLRNLDLQRKPLLALLQSIQEGDALVRLPPDQIVREIDLNAAIDGPLKDLRAQVNEYFADERRTDIRARMRAWTELRERLRTDADTEFFPPLP
jgi:hypothetical protein